MALGDVLDTLYEANAYHDGMLFESDFEGFNDEEIEEALTSAENTISDLKTDLDEAISKFQEALVILETVAEKEMKQINTLYEKYSRI